MRFKTAWVALAGGALLVPLSLLLAASPARPAPRAPAAESGSFRLFHLVTAKSGPTIKVTRGTAEEARQYLADASVPLKIRLVLRETTIDQILQYIGRGDLRAADLEQRTGTGGDVLTTRFFAPKIIDVSGKTPLTYGWRKIIRLASRDGSLAKQAGISTFYLLFNFASTEPRFPEGKNAGQIQAILVPTYPRPAAHRDLYFLVFNALNGKCPDGTACPPGTLGDHLNASFDFATAGPGQNDQYFLPRSCGQCHGTTQADQRGAKINYLDTDHWLDRVQPGDDFPLVRPQDVLVDGGEPAFAAIRRFNEEIRDQNAAVGTTFQLAAVRNWLDRHRTNSGHLAPIDRPIPPATAGGPIWTKGNPVDEALLPLLNRNCFRCHSSINYHVFDKQAVLTRTGLMASLIGSGSMPQDRRLPDATKRQMQDLLGQVRATAKAQPAKR
jgi:hypothetical protein